MEALGPTPSPSSRPGRGDLDKDDPVLVLKEFPAPPRMHSRTPVGRDLRGPSQESQPSGIRGRTKLPGMEWTGWEGMRKQVRMPHFCCRSGGQEGFQAVGLVAHISQIQPTTQNDTKKPKG